MNDKPNNLIEIDPALQTVQCHCKNKIYTLIVEPIIKDGSAKIVHIICTNCGHAVAVTGDAIIGDKKKVYVDHLGKKHHRINVDKGILGKVH